MTVAGQREIDDTKLFVSMHRDAIRKAVEALGVASKRLVTAEGIVPNSTLEQQQATFRGCIGMLGDVVLAAEAMEAAASEAAKKLRAHMVTLMELGATRVETGSGTWSLADLPDLVDIPNAAAVPEEFLAPAEPKPDRAKIKIHLARGARPNWATMLTGRGSSVRFSPRKG